MAGDHECDQRQQNYLTKTYFIHSIFRHAKAVAPLLARQDPTRPTQTAHCGAIKRRWNEVNNRVSTANHFGWK